MYHCVNLLDETTSLSIGYTNKFFLYMYITGGSLTLNTKNLAYKNLLIHVHACEN